MSDKFIFYAYPIILPKTKRQQWMVDYPLDNARNLLDTLNDSLAGGIVALLQEVTTPNGHVTYEPPHTDTRIHTFECEPMGAEIFTTLAIDGKLEYSTVDESAAFGRWELAQALLEDEVKHGT